MTLLSTIVKNTLGLFFITATFSASLSAAFHQYPPNPRRSDSPNPLVAVLKLLPKEQLDCLTKIINEAPDHDLSPKDQELLADTLFIVDGRMPKSTRSLTQQAFDFLAKESEDKDAES